MHKGSVIWVTGLPGAGKTTFAKGLYQVLSEQRADVIHLDGDSLRELFANFDYSIKGRKSIAAQYSKLALMLATQNKVVVVSTVSLFHEVHAWNRVHLPSYTEVFIDASKAVLAKRNQKQLYNKNRSDASNIVGQGIEPEFPVVPDFHFQDEHLADINQCIKNVVVQKSLLSMGEHE